MKTLFRVVLALVVVLVILIALAIGLLLTFDLNRVKPVLQNAAQERGLELAIPGDLGWRFFPTLGLELGSMSLKNAASGEDLASIESASVTVLIKPLFSKEIAVDGLEVVGMEANYRVNNAGVSGWQPLIDSLQAQPDAPEEEKTAGAPSVEIKRIDIRELAATYHDEQTGSQMRLSNTSIQSSEFALDGSQFPLELDATVQYGDYAEMTVRWQSPMAINLAEQNLVIKNGVGSVTTNGARADLELSNNLTWSTPLSSAGDLEVSGDDLQALLQALQIDAIEPTVQNALQKFALQVQYEQKGNNIRLQRAKLHIDETEIDGTLRVQNDQKIQLQSEWKINKIDLDRYFPPVEAPTEEPSAKEPTEEPAAQQSDTPPRPLPFEILRKLQADVSVSVGELIAKGITSSDINLVVQANNGLVTLQKLNGKVVDGTFNGQGVLDARRSPVELDVSLDTQKINLGKLVTILAGQDHLAGTVAADVQITSQGATVEALTDNLQMQAQAQSEHLKLVPFNIEQQFCTAIALLQRSEPKQHEWPNETLLEPVQIQLNYAKNTLQLEGLNAEIANLMAAATGKINIETGKFNVPFSLSLGDFADTLPGCLPIDEKWRKRALPIRCKGSLDTIGVRTCLPDTELLTSMLKDRVEQKAKEKLEKEKDRAEEKLGDKAKELLNKELGEEKAKETENKVRSVLDRLKDR